MDAFGPIKGAVNTAALVGSLGSLASEKAKENKLTEKQQELDKREEIANLKQAKVNTNSEINDIKTGIKENEVASLQAGIERNKALAGYKANDRIIGNSIEKIRDRYTSKATGGHMSKEKAMEVQAMNYNIEALKRSRINLIAQQQVKEELNQIRKERIAELQGIDLKKQEAKQKEAFKAFSEKRYGKKEGVKTNE